LYKHSDSLFGKYGFILTSLTTMTFMYHEYKRIDLIVQLLVIYSLPSKSSMLSMSMYENIPAYVVMTILWSVQFMHNTHACYRHNGPVPGRCCQHRTRTGPHRHVYRDISPLTTMLIQTLIRVMPSLVKEWTCHHPPPIIYWNQCGILILK